MPPTRQGVGQHVVRAVDEAHFVVVAVVALVEACQPTQVGGAHVGGNGALVVSGDGWGVVAQSGNGPLTHIKFLGDDLRLGQDARLFQITVSDIASRVVVGDQTALDVGRKGSSPEDGVVVGSERNPPMPVRQASTVPKMTGVSATISPRRVGRSMRLLASRSKS